MNTHCMFLSLYVTRLSRLGRRFSGLRLLVALLCTASLTLAAHAQHSVLTRHEHEVALNGQASLVRHLPTTQPMRLVLVLPLSNRAALDNFLNDLYDLSNASYRKFFMVEEFTARFGPSQEDYDSVIRFAEAKGVYRQHLSPRAE